MPRIATPLSVLALLGASVALTACGGSSGSSSSTSGGSGSASAGGTSTTAGGQNGPQNANFQKFRQCLQDNGVTLPPRGQGGGQGAPGGGYGPGAGGGAPGGGPGASSDPKTAKAMQACAKYRPQGGPGGGNGQRPQQNIKAFTPYLNCLKDQGLNVKVSDGFNALRGLKQSDPKVQAAFKACQSKLPQRPNGAAGAGTATTGTT